MRVIGLALRTRGKIAMADAARPWDGLLSAAVRHGLTSPSSASPDVAALSPFPADTPETGVVEPLGEDELRAREATDLVEEEDAAAQLSEMAASLAAETRRRLQGALARSVELLRSTPSAAELQAELEAWLLEAGRLEATLEDALEASTGALAASAERLARAKAFLDVELGTAFAASLSAAQFVEVRARARARDAPARGARPSALSPTRALSLRRARCA